MLKITCKIRLNRTVRAKCERHSKYDPAIEGKNYILDRCSTCRELLDLYESMISLEKALKNFERRAAPWERVRKSSNKKVAPSLNIASGPVAQPLE